MQKLCQLRASRSLSLTEWLTDKDLTAEKLFAQKNICSELKNNIQTFVKYSLRHRNFIYHCFKIGLNSSYDELQRQNYQNIAFNISQILCSDEPAMADLFFQPSEQQMRKGSQISQKIEEEQTDNIQSQAERLFSNDQPQQNLDQIAKVPLQITRDELARRSFEILNEQVVNESCLGYLYKIWSFLIRNNSNQVLLFFSSNRDCFQLLISNLKYCSISNLLAQLLVCEDRTKQYKFEKFKKQIFQRVIGTLLKDKKNQDLYEGTTIFIEEVLNNSKQSYYEYFQDFKRLVSYLSCSQVLNSFYNILLQKDQRSFANSLKYLQLIFERINSQKQDNHMERQSAKDEVSMVFQIDIFLEGFQRLIDLADQIASFSTIGKISYLTFLTELIKSPKFQKNQEKLQYPQALSKLIKLFIKQESKGLYKVKLFKLLQEIIKKCKKQQIESIMESAQIFYEKSFQVIKNLNFQNTKTYNKNETVAFQCKILFEIDNKMQNSVEMVSRIHSKNLKRVQKKYETKIANFGKYTKTFSLQEEGAFFNFSESIQKFGQKSQGFSQNAQTVSQSNVVGKNNISIPVLHLPQGLKLNKQNSQRKNKMSSNQNNQVSKQTSSKHEQIIYNPIKEVLDAKQNSTKGQNSVEKNSGQTLEKIRQCQDSNKVKDGKSAQQGTHSKIKYFFRHELLYF